MTTKLQKNIGDTEQAIKDTENEIEKLKRQMFSIQYTLGLKRDVLAEYKAYLRKLQREFEGVK
jgi:chromosome segregation ATPase